MLEEVHTSWTHCFDGTEFLKKYTINVYRSVTLNLCVRNQQILVYIAVANLMNIRQADSVMKW